MNKYLDMLLETKGKIVSEPNGWARNKNDWFSPRIVQNWISNGLVEQVNGYYQLTEKAEKQMAEPQSPDNQLLVCVKGKL